MKVLVCGGRDFANIAFVYSKLDSIHIKTPITALMQGGARGADSIARDWAVGQRGVQRYVCRADWEKYGKKAGPIRNARMLEWKPDLIVAFPGNRGTADMVEQGKKAGVRVIEFSI